MNPHAGWRSRCRYCRAASQSSSRVDADHSASAQPAPPRRLHLQGEIRARATTRRRHCWPILPTGSAGLQPREFALARARRPPPSRHRSRAARSGSDARRIGKAKAGARLTCRSRSSGRMVSVAPPSGSEHDLVFAAQRHRIERQTPAHRRRRGSAPDRTAAVLHWCWPGPGRYGQHQRRLHLEFLAGQTIAHAEHAQAPADRVVTQQSAGGGQPQSRRCCRQAGRPTPPRAAPAPAHAQETRERAAIPAIRFQPAHAMQPQRVGRYEGKADRSRSSGAPGTLSKRAPAVVPAPQALGAGDPQACRRGRPPVVPDRDCRCPCRRAA